MNEENSMIYMKKTRNHVYKYTLIHRKNNKLLSLREAKNKHRKI